MLSLLFTVGFLGYVSFIWGVCVFACVCSYRFKFRLKLMICYMSRPCNACPTRKKTGLSSSHVFVCFLKIPVEYTKHVPLGLQAFLEQWVLHCCSLLVRGRRDGEEILVLNSKIYLMLYTC